METKETKTRFSDIFCPLLFVAIIALASTIYNSKPCQSGRVKMLAFSENMIVCVEAVKP